MSRRPLRTALRKRLQRMLREVLDQYASERNCSTVGTGSWLRVSRLCENN